MREELHVESGLLQQVRLKVGVRVRPFRPADNTSDFGGFVGVFGTIESLDDQHATVQFGKFRRRVPQNVLLPAPQ